MAERVQDSIESRPVDALDRVFEAARKAGSQRYNSILSGEAGEVYESPRRTAVQEAAALIRETLSDEADHAIDILVDEAFSRDREIQEEAEQAALGRRFLASEVKKAKAAILDGASSHFFVVADKEAALLDGEGELQFVRNLPAPRSHTYIRWILDALIIFLVAAPFVALGFGIVILSSPVLSAVPQGSFLVPSARFLTLTVAAVPICLVAAMLIYWFRTRLLDRLAKRHELLVKEYAENRRRELRLDNLREEIKFAQQAAQDALYRGVTGRLRAIISDSGEQDYSTELALLDAPGLAEVFDPTYEISTEAKDEVYRLLRSMPGGSIGIAGPRGVGKTTLLRSFCETSTITLSGRPRLSVLTSAPVEYEAREFILHIFASLCQQVLDLKQHPVGGPPEYMGSKQPSPDRNRLIRSFLRNLDQKWQRPVFVIGLTLMLISIILAIANTSTGDELKGLLLFLNALGIKPAPLFYLGLFLGGLGFAFPRLRRIAEGASDSGSHESSPLRPQEMTLAVRAENWLHEIRFQQSYSSGWAGTLKAPLSPISVEARVDAAIQLAEYQKTLPEIMSGYRQLLADASNEYDVIIGIDELDKIDSEEKAQRFLNEIKALFGLERCFYLVSISENAMSSFERRGLPFRDVFDSSFDSIVQVNYLDAEKARRLLHTRVIGIPIPFLDFCYCMAGGLPRDLVRVCRELFRVRKQNPDTEPLSKLTCKLIESDIKRKLHAVSVAAKDMAWGSEANELLRKIRQLEMAVKPVDNSSEDHPYLSTVLVPWRLSLTSFANFLESTPQMPITDGTSKPHELIASLSGELGVYLYYSATLLEFFDERTLSEDILRDESYQVMVDQLAAARQYLAVSPSIAGAMITEFRAHYNMPLIR